MIKQKLKMKLDAVTKESEIDIKNKQELIDEEINPLIEELKKNRFQCAIDVYDKEPLDPNSPLWDFKNILLLPHITGKFNMQRTVELGCELALYNLDAFLNNKPLRNVVDFSTGYKKSNKFFG